MWKDGDHVRAGVTVIGLCLHYLHYLHAAEALVIRVGHMEECVMTVAAVMQRDMKTAKR